MLVVRLTETPNPNTTLTLTSVVPTWAYLLYPYILDKDFGFGQLYLTVVGGQHIKAALSKPLQSGLGLGLGLADTGTDIKR